MLFQKGHTINNGRSPWNKGTKGISIGGRKFGGVEVVCGCGCNKTKKIAKSRVMEVNFYSPEHFKEYQKGKKWWDEEFRKTQSGENNHNFKGIMASESALHQRNSRQKKGELKSCLNCGSTELLQWSNQSGLYFDDPDDFGSRCPKCHKAYDTKQGFPRKKSFDKQGRRIGITIIIPEGY